jgi:hypothetical protein
MNPGDEYRVGRQMCDSFMFRRTIPAVPDATCRKNGCVARVRYCECCGHPHHEGGLETCPVLPKSVPRTETQWAD